MQITSYGAAGQVTGSCHLLEVAGKQILLDCGMIQGSSRAEAHNRDRFAFDVKKIDAVILSHAHIDHSGRLPVLHTAGYQGPIYTHEASFDLCKVLLKDSAYIHEKEAEWQNRKRERKGMEPVSPLYSQQDVENTLEQFEPLQYNTPLKLADGVTVTLHDAGHILGSAIVELTLSENGVNRTLVFSGDLGQRNSPILRDYTRLKHADLVLMESTYGDRDHRDPAHTFAEVSEIVEAINSKPGNVLIPAFSVGRSQLILYMFAKYFDEWDLGRWQIFLDSPMAIEATRIYARHKNLYDDDARAFEMENDGLMRLPNLIYSQRSEQSMQINRISSGAIIIAGSGMCTGGRIRHHLKHNVWRNDCHVVITGYQAYGTIGRDLVEGKSHIRLWGEAIKVGATIHTIGGLSAHAGQSDLLHWYDGFENRPRVLLVHGEERGMTPLLAELKSRFNAPAEVAEQGRTYRF
ncbi:MBL fold metallo-hydrolase [Granulosicoccaceae sp. 1_MG-2023]|nr:MBL fold metallo-hydrolase [Granulosicoccaceae sp. 1_MG-2023]